MSSPTISEKVISANLFLRVVPLLFGGMCASFVCRNRGCHSKNLLPKRSAICLCQFPKAPILTLVGIQFNFFKSVVLGARMCKPLSYLVTGETAQDAERYSSLVFTAKGSPRKNCGSKQLNPLMFQPRWPRERAIPEAGGLQFELQLPQNTRPCVCALCHLISFWQ